MPITHRQARRSSQKSHVPAPSGPEPAPAAHEEEEEEAGDEDAGRSLRFESCPIIRSASQASLSDKSVSDYETFMQRQLELNEARRGEALTRLGIDFQTPQNRFDNITALIKSTFGVGLSTVSIIEGDMAYFMSRAGDWAPGAPRKMTLCQCLSDSNDSRLLVVENVQTDPRWVWGGAGVLQGCLPDVKYQGSGASLVSTPVSGGSRDCLWGQCTCPSSAPVHADSRTTHSSRARRTSRFTRALP